MNSYSNLNETTKNLLKAIQEYKPLESRPTVWKLIYNSETGRVLDVTAGEPPDNSDWFQITADEAKLHLQWDPRVRIKDKKIVKIKLPSDLKQPSSEKRCVWSDPDGNYSSSDFHLLIPGNTRKWRID